jgi:RHS repeat-associated protein
LDTGQREVKDRLGSVRALESGPQYRYLPYGEEEGIPTPDGRVKFATYERDSTASAQDYAGQRYYSNVYGRFFSADPGGVRTANPRDPGSWNRYGYVQGDPVNFTDRHGLYIDVTKTAKDCIDDPEGCNDSCSPANFALGLMGDPTDPGCPGGGGGPVAGPGDAATEASWSIYVVASSDCYRPFVGKPGVWERDITYSAFKVYADGSSDKLTGDGSTRIEENLAYISGPKPSTSHADPGQPFLDQISAGNGANFTLTQTFSVMYQGVPYAALIRSVSGRVSNSNSIDAHSGYVDVNNDPNLGRGGSHPLCPTRQ